MEPTPLGTTSVARVRTNDIGVSFTVRGAPPERRGRGAEHRSAPGARRVGGTQGSRGAHRRPGGHTGVPRRTQESQRCAQGAGASPRTGRATPRSLRTPNPVPPGRSALGQAGRAFPGGSRWPRPPLPRRTSGNVVRAAPLRKFFTLHVSLTAGLGFLGKGGQAGGRRRPLARAGRGGHN